MSLSLNKKLIYHAFLATPIIIAVLFVSALPARASVISRPPTNQGLIGYWNFNDGTGTNAQDYSGNGNNGTLQNTEESDWVDGKIGKAVQIDGSNEYINVPGTGNVLDTGGPFTIGGWFKLDDTNHRWILASRWKVSSNPILLLGSMSADYTGILALIKTSGGELYVQLGGQVEAGKWYHLIAVYDGGVNLKIYLNGELKNTNPNITGALLTGVTDLNIGFNEENVQYLKGIVDEIRLYNRALSTSEIFRLYKMGASRINTSQTNKLTNGLVGMWSFDGPDMAGVTAYDRSGNNYHGTLENTLLPIIGKVGQALDFDGISDRVTHSLVLSKTQGTIAHWIKVRSTVNVGYYQSNGTSPGSPDYNGFGCAGTCLEIHTYYNTGDLGFVYQDGDNPADLLNISKSGYVQNEWYYLVAAWETAGSAELYVNGVQVASGDMSAKNFHNLNASVQQFGRVGTTATPERYLDGAMDEVRVYNRKLSPQEIKRLYNMSANRYNSSQANSITNGLVGMWSFDGPDISGVTAYDRFGSNDGTLINDPLPTIGVIGQALEFDGVDDYINVSNESNFDFERTNAFSLFAWVKPNNGVGGAIIAKMNPTTYLGYSLDICCGSAANVRGQLRYSGDYTIIRDATEELSYNDWHLIGYTYNGSSLASGMLIYVDGNVVSSTIIKNTIGSYSVLNNQNINIGSRAGGANLWFPGRIDDVRVYDRALSADEVNRLYKMGGGR